MLLQRGPWEALGHQLAAFFVPSVSAHLARHTRAPREVEVAILNLKALWHSRSSLAVPAVYMAAAPGRQTEKEAVCGNRRVPLVSESSKIHIAWGGCDETQGFEYLSLR